MTAGSDGTAGGRRFFILDPDLRSGFSHNLTATTRVARAAQAAGYAVTCIVNRKFSYGNTDLESVCDDVRRIWPTYALNASDDPQPEGPLPFHPVYDANLPGWEKYLFGLLELHATLESPQDAIFYIHTLSAPGTMGLLQYLLSIPPHQRPRIHALIYCTQRSSRASVWWTSPPSRCWNGCATRGFWSATC